MIVIGELTDGRLVKQTHGGVVVETEEERDARVSDILDLQLPEIESLGRVESDRAVERVAFALMKAFLPGSDYTAWLYTPAAIRDHYVNKAAAFINAYSQGFPEEVDR